MTPSIINPDITPGRMRVGAELGRAGEWMHFIAAAWLAFHSGGPGLVTAYLLLAAAPATRASRWARTSALLAPVGVLFLAAAPRPSPPLAIGAAAVVVGVGSAAVGRPVAWLAGIHGGPGWGGVAGAAAAVALTSAGGVSPTLVASAALMVGAFLVGEDHPVHSRVPRGLVPAAGAVAFTMGLRVLEPGFEEGALPAPAAFAFAWAVGAHLGFSRAVSTDPRVVLAGPFAAAACVVLAGVLEGPGLLLLYALLAASVALVGGVGEVRSGIEGMSYQRSWLLVAMALGGVWAWISVNVEVTTGLMGVVALGGGFLSLRAARRLAAAASAPPPAATALRASAPAVRPRTLPVTNTRAPGAAIEETKPEDHLVEGALTDLREALRRARGIRAEALAELRAASVHPDPRSQALEVIAGLQRAAARAREKMASAVR